jgi:hypothetical protein
MESFTTVAALPIYLSLAFFISFISDWIIKKAKLSPKYRIATVIILFIILAVSRMDFGSLKANNGFWGNDVYCFNSLKHNKEVYMKLKLPTNTVLCNVPGRHYIEAMFYTGLPAYGFIPTESQYNELQSKGKRMALFMHYNDKVPAYLKDNHNVIMLKDSLELCE